MISHSDKKEDFLHLRKWRCHNLNVLTVPAVADSTSVQLSTAVTSGVALPVLSKLQPEGGPATAGLANRLECPSAVSSRLSDTAHTQVEQTGRQNYLLTAGKSVFTVDINFIDISVNHVNLQAI